MRQTQTDAKVTLQLDTQKPLKGEGERGAAVEVRGDSGAHSSTNTQRLTGERSQCEDQQQHLCLNGCDGLRLGVRKC